ncbi:hypothetical protein EJ04DRAFT_62938 [Polyplosphaeria fusca]|uniref:Uncharacterized protein n=1 Tax=Polyplosphaeria fusca TaxID=682080 RepID=A0A9P4UY54_9PLEO|nr:hypothetical protein EJ04DRAFT_62938 [Polyplosphaeria fusca]
MVHLHCHRCLKAVLPNAKLVKPLCRGFWETRYTAVKRVWIAMFSLIFSLSGLLYSTSPCDHHAIHHVLQPPGDYQLIVVRPQPSFPNRHTLAVTLSHPCTSRPLLLAGSTIKLRSRASRGSCERVRKKA